MERVSKSELLDKVILATTIREEDDFLCEYVRKLGYTVYRGDENDVLKRYYKAFLTLGKSKDKVKGIVRITGDCPLFEPENCDSLLKNFIDKKLDYNYLSQNFAEGLDCEVFTPKALLQANKLAKLKSEREHVSRFFHNNLNLFKIETFDKKVDDSKYRITVDEPEDFLVIKNIIINLSKKKLDLNFYNVKKYLDENPRIFSINSSIIRNEGLKKSLQYHECV